MKTASMHARQLTPGGQRTHASSRSRALHSSRDRRRSLRALKAIVTSSPSPFLPSTRLQPVPACMPQLRFLIDFRALQARNVYAASTIAKPSDATKKLLEAQQAEPLSSAAASSEQLRVLYEGIAAGYAMIADAVGLQATPTSFSDSGLSSFGGEGGPLAVKLLASRGGQVDWMTAVCSYLSSFNGGLTRLTAFASDSTEAPHLFYELGYSFGKVQLYLDLPARVNLLLDEEYFCRFYQQKGRSGLSMNDLELQLQEDGAFEPFRSKSPDIRLLAGPTSLLYTAADGSVESAQKAIDFGQKVIELWLEFIQDPANALRAEKREEVALHDIKLRASARKDPGNQIIVGILGEEKVEEILKLTCGDVSPGR